MPFPKLSPLQSRFAASLAASLILLLIYLALTKPHFAYAVELDSRIPPDHNHPIIIDTDFEDEIDGTEDESFADLDVERRQTSLLYLRNNEPQNRDLTFPEIQNWVFTKDSIDGPAGEMGKGLPGENTEIAGQTDANMELKKRQSAKQVFITLTTCTQPLSLSNSTDPNIVVPPQLTLYYSQSDSNQMPGPTSTGAQQNITFDGGYAIINITSDNSVYVGVIAPNVTGFTGSYNYEIAASIDAPYHSVDDDTPGLYFVDGDNHAALFITDDLTTAPSNSSIYQEWMSMPPPFGMMGQDQNNPAILGVLRSYCGLRNSAKIMVNLENIKNHNVASMTDRGLGANPKEQFYVGSLNASSSYWGFLAMEGNSTASGLNVVGGGGKVWAAVNFSTKAESNCALLYNLSFCSEVAYAVPSNPDLFPPNSGLPELGNLYDSYAEAAYQQFNYSLQQIPCNTTASAQYSLARNCDDCASAYKQWLCAVTIPRCEDYTNNATYLKPRNVAQPFPNGTMLSLSSNSQFLLNSMASNQSRNPLIDSSIKPGPYKEVLPCIDLCFDLVQSCPAALGFGCPHRGAGMQDSYGERSSDSDTISCSWLGAAYDLSGADKVAVITLSRVGLVLALSLFFAM